MDPALVKQLLLGVVPPMLFGVVVFAALWLWRGKELAGGVWNQQGAVKSLVHGWKPVDTGRYPGMTSPWWHDVVLVVCVGIAFLGVYPMVFGPVRAWPGNNADSALFWCALVAVATGLASSFIKHATLRGVLIGLALLLCGWMSFRRHWSGPWSTLETLASIVMLAAGGGMFILGLGMLGRSGRVAGVWSAVIAIGLCAQVLVVNLASLKHGQGAGAIASFLMPALLLVLVRPSRGFGAPLMVTVGLLLATQLMQGLHFGDGRFPWLMVGLALIGPMCGVLAMRMLTGRGLASVAVPIIATALPGIVAVGSGAVMMSQAEMAPAATEEYDY